MGKFLLISSLLFNLALQSEIKVLAFSGSTRVDSYNKKLINQASIIARELGASVTVIDLKDYPIPHYDQDLENTDGIPENAKKIRDLIFASDAVIISTPQYNASIPSVLKNVLDWASRKHVGPTKSPASGKKYAIMSASTGNGGGRKGLNHLCVILKDMKGIVIGKKISVQKAQTAFDENGLLINQSLKNELEQEIRELLK